eukprot:UN31387
MIFKPSKTLAAFVIYVAITAEAVSDCPGIKQLRAFTLTECQTFATQNLAANNGSYYAAYGTWPSNTTPMEGCTGWENEDVGWVCEGDGDLDTLDNCTNIYDETNQGDAADIFSVECVEEDGPDEDGQCATWSEKCQNVYDRLDDAKSSIDDLSSYIYSWSFEFD